MKDFNNDKDLFNDSLKEKFDAAKFEPSGKLWEGIEGELLKHDNIKIQRKANFYRNVAAAILLIAMISIYFNIQTVDFMEQESNSIEEIDLSNSKNYFEENASEDALNEPKQAKVVFDSKLPESQEGRSSALAKEGAQNISNEQQTASFISGGGGSGKTAQEKTIAAPAADFTVQNRQKAIISVAKLEAEEGHEQGGVMLNQLKSRIPATSDFSELALADIAVENVSYFAVSSLEKPKTSSAMAFESAFNIGSGSFNPNTDITSGPSQLNFSTLNTPGTSGRSVNDVQQEYSQEKALVQDLSSAPLRSSISMSLGVQAGLHINDRWKIRSGVQYGNYRSSSESSAVLRDVNSDEFFPYHGASSTTELSEGKIVNVTSEYDLYNNFQILSVPLIVSYKFLDRKFGMALVAGASADLLIKNTITTGSEKISDISFDKNDDQSYKNIFYSGLAGVEFSYSFSKNYAISITPTYKKALMNITKSDANFRSSPDFISLDMSIQYLF